MKRFALFALIITLKSYAAPAKHQGRLSISPDQELSGLTFGAHMSYLNDVEQKFQDEAILRGDHDQEFIPSEKDLVAFPLGSRHPHWVKFTITNTSDTDRYLFLESDYVITDRVRLIHQHQGETLLDLELGDQVAFNKRTIPHRNPLFELTLKPGDNHFYSKMVSGTTVKFDFKLWDPGQFRDSKLFEYAFVGFIYGGITLLWLYNVFISVSLRSSTYILYTCYITAYLVYAIAFYGFMPLFFPSDQANILGSGWDLYLFVDLVSISAILFSIDFLVLKEKFIRAYHLLRIAAGFVLTNMMFNFLTTGAYGFSNKLSFLCSLVISILLIAIGVVVSLRKYPPAKIYVVAWSTVLGGNTLLLLSLSGVIETTFVTTWAQFTGCALEMVLLSFALGAKMSLERQQKLQLEVELRQESEKSVKMQEELVRVQEQHIKELDVKVKERTADLWAKTRSNQVMLDHVEQGICTVDEDLTLDAEYSKHMGSIFAHSNLANCGLDKLLFDDSDLSEEQKSQIREVVKNTIDADLINFSANRHLLPGNVVLNPKYSPRHLQIDWAAIENQEDEVEKIMLTIRDVTQQKKTEAEAAESARELRMIGSIIKLSNNRFQSFVTSSRALLQDCYHIFEQDNFTAHWKALLRHVHTLKGNARTFGFADIAEATHEAETKFFGLKAEDLTSDQILMIRSKIDQIEAMVEDYIRVNSDVLGREEDKKTEETLIELAGFIKDAFQNAAFKENFGKDQYAPLLNKLHSLTSTSLEAIFEPIQQSIELTAKQLGKKKPKLIFSGQAFQVDKLFAQKLENIFGHLVRNSLDHGFTDRSENTIYLHCQSSDTNFLVNYSDSGRGLNLNKLRQRGKDLGILDDTASPQSIAELIFTSQISTRDQVTEVSGRGVGMDAVAQYLKDMGGKIELKLDGSPDSDGFQKFSFQVELPHRLAWLDQVPMPTAS